MTLEWWPIIKGAATYIPCLYDAERGETGGSQSARYCYAVWMRHLLASATCGLSLPIRSVAELGPGDSLGIGIAALLSGAEKLQAFDVVRYASNDRNVTVLHELVQMFRARAPVPSSEEFPAVFPRVPHTVFPARLWSRGVLDELLSDERIAAIERALRGNAGGPIEVSYIVPWNVSSDRARATVDLVFSQAVLEHVDELPGAYAALGAWIAPGAYTSNVIDFRSHHITPGWDGHLQYSPSVWRVVRGRRPYLLNRRAPSEHLAQLRLNGFEVLQVEREYRQPTVATRSLAAEFAGWSDDDRRTSTMHVIARRPVDGAVGLA